MKNKKDRCSQGRGSLLKYRISNIKISVSVPDQNKEITRKIKSKISGDINLYNLVIYKRSIDAREKKNIMYVYTIDFETKKPIKNYQKLGLAIPDEYEYIYPEKGKKKLLNSPIVCGFGPSGIFSALMLAENGYNPIIIERGKKILERKEDIKNFWSQGILNTESNIQFGEGGAGAFSDGKLTTQTKNPRSRKVLEVFVENGAPEEILYDSKPHIGTDLLRNVIISIREKIESLGGTFLFDSKVEEILTDENNILQGVIVNGEKIETQVMIIAPGNSSRDTFEMLCKKGVHMTSKPFAVGLRIEHLQDDVNESQYGEMREYLGAADYKLTFNGNKRSLYTFCMCPGGYVINGASEEDTVVTNGMSYHSRKGENANSAILVNINPEDFGGDDNVLAGIEFQRNLEKLAFKHGGSNYKAPVQLAGDFLKDKVSIELGTVKPTIRPGYKFVNFNDFLPSFISETIKEGLINFSGKMKAFQDENAVLTGIETRSSSPVRIVRKDGESTNIAGLFPSGEGAGYAGGIMSAAVDGIVSAEEVIKRYFI